MDNKINWGQKLTSRKLWCAILAAIVTVLVGLFGDVLTPETAEIVRYGIYALIAYIFGESAVDIARQIADKIKDVIGNDGVENPIGFVDNSSYKDE